MNLTSRYVKLSLIKEYENRGLIIDWHLQSLLDGHAMVKHHYQGKMNFDLATASAAFGIIDLCHSSSFWMVDKYGATAARQGFFIRYQDYLCLPGPGTGRDGDSNLSILLDEEIQDWVLKLLPTSDESRQLPLLPKPI